MKTVELEKFCLGTTVFVSVQQKKRPEEGGDASLVGSSS